MIKVGLCGTGFMGQMHAACYAAIPGVRLAAVASKRKDIVRKVAREHGAEVFADAREVITKAKVDVVDICLPTYMHCSHVLLAARRGLDCLCEKPIARTLSEANRIVKGVRAAGIKFMVGHVIRFWPEYQVLKEYVARKKLGRPTAFSFRRTGERPDFGWKNWFQKQLYSGGAFLDLHIHDSDYIRYLLGEPQGVDSTGGFRRGAWDYVFTNYHYPNLPVSAEGGWTVADPFDMSFRAVFDKGTLAYSSRLEPLTLYAPGKKPVKVKVPQPRTRTVAAGGNISALGGYFNEIKYFVDCLKKGKHPEVVTPEEARASLGLVFRELASAQKKVKK